MNKLVRRTALFACVALLYFPVPATAQSASDVILPVTVSTQKNPASVTLSFPAVTNATGTTIRRRRFDQSNWTTQTLPASATTFTDATVSTGIGYEYVVSKQVSAAPVNRYGIVAAGIDLPAPTYRGKVILVIDNTLSSPLAVELERLVQDLRGDGWQVLRHDIDVTASTVATVKALIRNDYESDMAYTSAAFLIGQYRSRRPPRSPGRLADGLLLQRYERIGLDG